PARPAGGRTTVPPPPPPHLGPPWGGGGAWPPPASRRARGLFLRFLEEGLVLAVAFRVELLDGDEAHRGRVHAITLAGGRGPVVEDVAQMGVGVRRPDLGARIADQEIRARLDVPLLEGLREARPTRARLELVERGEERLSRDHVHVDPGRVVVPVLVGEGPLGPRVLRDVVLGR